MIHQLGQLYCTDGLYASTAASEWVKCQQGYDDSERRKEVPVLLNKSDVHMECRALVGALVYRIHWPEPAKWKAEVTGASVRGYSTESVAHNPHQLQDLWVTDPVIHLIGIFA